MHMRRFPHKNVAQLICALALAPACGGDAGPVAVGVGYDDSSQRVLALLDRPLAKGETLHMRLRGGDFGELNCKSEFDGIRRIDGNKVKNHEQSAYAGDEVDPTLFDPVMDESWFNVDEATPEMLAALEAADQIIDICVMKDDKVVRQAEFTLQQALDKIGKDGKYDGEGGRVNSVEAYAEICTESELLGEIPFFPPVLDESGNPVEGDYHTYNCLNAVPIPMAVTGEDGVTRFPADEDHEGVSNGGECDAPMHLDSHCERNAVPGESNGPRVISATNEQGTHWVLLCRKTPHEEGQFNDMAMIGHNPINGKTCFFQNGLNVRTDGVHVAHPGDTVSSDESPLRANHTWRGIHGGLGSGIECTDCHDADPFVHTPFIDAAVWPDDHPEVTGEAALVWESRGFPPEEEDRVEYKPVSVDRRKAGASVVPKMGEDDDFYLGNNASPFTVVNMEGQGWEMAPHLVNDKVAACTSCHRMAGGRWNDSWLRRQDLEDPSYTAAMTEHGKKFENRIWMPPAENLAEEGIFDEEDFDNHPFREAIDFLQMCGDSWQQNPDWETEECDPAGDECCWERIPDKEIEFDGTLPVIDLEGEELAVAALKALGAPIEDSSCPIDSETGEHSCETQRCNACHAMSPFSIEDWGSVHNTAVNQCNLDVDPDEISEEKALEIVNCMRAEGNPDGVFDAARVGILNTGVNYDIFPKLFNKAYGQQGRREFNRFRARIGMPQGNHKKLELEEYATVKKWFERDLPKLHAVFTETGRPEECEPHVNVEAMTAHVERMKFEGWHARNMEAGIRMFSCTDDDDPNSCFNSGFSDVTGRLGGDVQDGFRLVEVVEFDFVTSFWTRSSADGRFVGNGGGTAGGSTITDLQRMKDIRIDASFDPGFFPDNSGFIFQGGFAGICEQSLLLNDNHVTFTEEGCIRAHGIDLYQHVARGTEGNKDYFIITGQHVNDPGSATNDPPAHFGESARIGLTPVIHTGSTYRQGQEVNVPLPFEGDSVLSPSGQLMVSRLSGPDGSLGYTVREFKATPNGDNSYDIDVDRRLATVCQQGVKANFSFDERFVVTQHYNGDGTADIWLMDLLDVDEDGNAARHRITKMPAGEKALFPHFISNGWFYFLHRNGNQRKLVASNAAAILAGGGGEPPPPPGSNCCQDGSDSSTPGFDRSGCDNPTCEAAMCEADAWCCDNEWDAICERNAPEICPQICG